MKAFFAVVAVVLVGCGGGDFQTEPGLDATVSDANDSVDAPIDTGTGGRSASDGSETGGAPVKLPAAAGGAPSSAGGAPPGTGGSPSATDAATCAPVTHDDGAGQTWQDCVAQGTLDNVQAETACNTWCAVNGGCKCTVGRLCADDFDRVYAYTGSIFMSWPWEGPNAGETVQSFPGGIGTTTCNVIGSWK